MTPFAFTVAGESGSARAGAFATPHGIIETPAFAPVGTLASVKALEPDDLRAMGTQLVLANAYHLHLRPGDEVVRRLGGLHRFSGWDGPMLTDSGGFQVFSLDGLRTVDDDGVTFQSHLDGAKIRFTPETVMRIERNLGADLVMQFDHVVPGQAAHAMARDASERSIRWLARARDAFAALEAEGTYGPQALLPIVQGGIHADLRRDAVRAIAGTGDWAAWAVGGLSVGEAKPDMYAMLEACDAVIPRDRPRYLMGVGFPEDLVEGIARGVDFFDCVAPTRMGRTGALFTHDGRLNIKRAEFREDDRPLDPDCECRACTRYSRAYLRHLFTAEEMTGLRLLSLHNVHFLVTLARRARAAILAGTFASWRDDFLRRYLAKPAS
ncbi:MAG: tRNA guanosine(34) transglycosylase Tgt [Gemmatimonadota bacterium]|nr:tRNA guanosine(34) transglycosylase Tgt [Gemmatimonadota bacterium]